MPAFSAPITYSGHSPPEPRARILLVRTGCSLIPWHQAIHSYIPRRLCSGLWPLRLQRAYLASRWWPTFWTRITAQYAHTNYITGHFRRRRPAHQNKVCQGRPLLAQFPFRTWRGRAFPYRHSAPEISPSGLTPKSVSPTSHQFVKRREPVSCAPYLNIILCISKGILTSAEPNNLLIVCRLLGTCEVASPNH